MNIDFLLGKDESSLKQVPGTRVLLQPMAIDAFTKLQSAAAQEGIDLQLVSAFRSYSRQEEIWNAKARGQRELLYSDGRIVDFHSLSSEELLKAILKWTAIPGTSRHHWGTDFDVFDATTQKKEEVKLLTSDWDSGPSLKLNLWLTDQIANNTAFGFFRPYEIDRGGVGREPWHLSFKPLADQYQAHYTYSVFLKNIKDSDLVLKEEILAIAPEIFQKFISI